MRKKIKVDLDVLALFEGLTAKQARKLRECALSILPPLRDAVMRACPAEPRENTDQVNDE